MDKNDIIERIATARNRINLSARKLSQKIDMNDCYINRLESQKDFLPSLEVLMRIIEECDLTPEQFFYYDMYEYKNDSEIISKLKRLVTIIDSIK